MKTLLLAASMLPAAYRTSYAQLSEEAIYALVQRQTDAWNRNDASAWAQDYVEDANFINIRGDLVRGRREIEEIHAFIFRGPYKDSHCSMTIESIRYASPEVAIVETLSEVTDFKGLPPGVVATAPGILRTRPKFVLVKQEDQWKIFAAQNTMIAPQPMPIQ